MAWIILIHAVVGFLIIGFGESLGRRAVYPALVPPLITLGWLATRLGAVVDGDTLSETISWVPQIGLAFDVRLDGFGALMVAIVSGIGVLVLWYAANYFPRRQYALGRLFGLLVLFSGAMVGLVVADNLLVLYGFWELTSICSFFLIGNRHSSAPARAASLQALLTTGLGALAMLWGFVLLGEAAGTYQISSLLADPPRGATVAPALVLVLLGAATKSAQYPFHFWLPGAMVAPTPISAYLHSATMVKAGVYLVARFSPAFVGVWIWRPAVVALGATTMLLGGLRALRQTDLKRLLAFGTVSQLGFMFVLFGMGTDASIAAGCVLLTAHAVFKATLFMGVGIIDHQIGTRDIALLPRLAQWRPLSAVLIISAASMAGVPLTFGFIAKEAGYEALLHSGTRFGGLVVAVVVTSSVLTFAYSARLVHGSLWAGGDPDAETAPADKEPSMAFLGPAVVLTGLTVLFGLVPGLLDGIASAATDALVHAVVGVHLAIWHGFNTALGLSAVTIAAGTVVFLVLGRIQPALALGSRIPDGGRIYRGILWGVNRGAGAVTGVVQSGSLPIYAGVVMLSTVAAPASALIGMPWDGIFEGADAPTPIVIASVTVVTILLAATVGAAVIRRRYAAALLLAGVGYSMAALFVVQGAPDLALTTVAVESLFTVLFVLVLRSLPERFEQTSPLVGRLFRLVISASVGAVVFLFALFAMSERLPSSTSQEMVARSLPDAHGRNVVNVILVDFRGFDTLGEITVLVAAAIGAVALARAVRRPGRPPDPPPEVATAPESPTGPFAAPDAAMEETDVRRLDGIHEGVEP